MTLCSNFAATDFPQGTLLSDIDIFTLVQNIMSTGTGYLVLASVDAYGHLIVSKLDASGKGTYTYHCCLSVGLIETFLVYSSHLKHY